MFFSILSKISPKLEGQNDRFRTFSCLVPLTARAVYTRKQRLTEFVFDQLRNGWDYYNESYNSPRECGILFEDAKTSNVIDKRIMLISPDTCPEFHQSIVRYHKAYINNRA